MEQQESRTVASIYAARARERETAAPWVHPVCQPLPTTRKGPLLPLSEGSLLTIDTERLLVSQDDGATWERSFPAAHGQDPAEPSSCHLLETASGTLVMVYLEMAARESRRVWDDARGEPGEGCRLWMCSVRSHDGGRTWRDRQRLLDGYNANFFGFIQLRGGRLVVVAEHLVANPGRWVACSLVSDDGGGTWRRGNLIDLGGHGHHDGATEPTVAELGDGRLMMLIRTNLGRFWQAFSDDGGRYWRTIQPSALDASSSPGQLLRLGSGRLVLAWNRRDPEDSVWPPAKPDDQHSEYPASWHREELSIALSGDDGATWSRPLVIARLKGGQLSYPHVLERRAGELWVIPGFASAEWFNERPVQTGMRIREDDLLDEIAGQ